MRTFPYRGRESLTIPQLLLLRPELREMYVYDVTLTNGSLLYSCAGGIGVTKEPFLVDMHLFLKTSTSVTAIKRLFESEYGGEYSRRKFHSSRQRFNEDPRRDVFSSERMARLYLLWAGSGFKHRYRGRGYDAQYGPVSLELENLAMVSRHSREKNLLFRREGFSTLSESICHDNVFLHAYLPTEFGSYGSGFTWSERALLNYVRILNEFHELGHKVCISALYKRRGRVFRDYMGLFPQFHHVEVAGFKVCELTLEPEMSEIHLFNF